VQLFSIIRRSNCFYATLVFSTLHGSAGCDESHPNQHPRQPTIQGEMYQCGIETVISPDDGHIVAQNICRSYNKDNKN